MRRLQQQWRVWAFLMLFPSQQPPAPDQSCQHGVWCRDVGNLFIFIYIPNTKATEETRGQMPQTKLSTVQFEKFLSGWESIHTS